MKSPQQLSQEIIDIIKATGNYFVGNTSGMSNDGTVNVYHPKGYSISAIAANPISSGEVIVFNVNGIWYAFGEQRTVIKQDILIQRKSKSRAIVNEVHSVITLIQSDLTRYSKPEGNKDIEYWLTGGKYTLKRIATDPTLGFNNSEAFVYYDGSDAFLQSSGNGKYLAATRSHEKPDINYGGAINRSYSRNIFTIQKEDKSVSKITSDFYGNFAYLGNGIYQSFIEDGIGQILNKVPKWVSIPGAAMRKVTDEFGGITYDGVRKGKEKGTDKDLRLDANILPETSNFVIYNGGLHQLSGSLSIDLANVFDRFKTYDEFIPSDTILTPVNTNEIMFTAIKDRTFGWRNKTVQHQIWLPTGDSVFNYSSTKTEFRNNLIGDENTAQYVYLYNYTFNETMSGEVLVVSWKSKYVTSTFEVEKESKDWTTRISGQNIITKTEEITNKTEILTLKTYGDTEGEKNLVLNSNGKWLILPRQPKQHNSDTNLTIAKDTTHFRVKVDIGYLGIVSDDYEPDYDLSSYVDENIITSFMINNSAYIVRGKISAINFELYSRNNTNQRNGRHWFTIEITQFKLVPKVEAKSDYGEYFLPFPSRIVLDNGCFWNYYLSHEASSINVETLVTNYPYFKGGNTYSQLSRFTTSLNSYILCNQLVKYIHTNPITVPFCSSAYIPPSSLLISDNLVGNSIYRVNDDILLQSYIENATNRYLGITKMPVSEWKIIPDGNIKYNNTFLVDYRLKRPYYNEENNESDAKYIIPVTHSYYSLN